MSDSSGVPSVEELLVRLAERDALIGVLTAKIETLTSRVAELEARLGKNSQNSSKPPSSDAFVKSPPRSLRRPSGRKPGKQSGEPGMRLEPVTDPDRVITHVRAACADCGQDLASAPVVAGRARQVFDLPPIRLQVTEHRVQARRCSCGTVTTAVFPVARTAELMADCFGASVSTGWLASLQGRAAARLGPFNTAVTGYLREAPVAHFDETGARVAGGLSWIHVACDHRVTRLHLAPSRGRSSMEIGQILGTGFTGVAVHDGLSAYRGNDLDHALCGAHHLRELVGITELTGQDWPTRLGDLLVEMHVCVNRARTAGKTSLSARRLAGYRHRYRVLVAEGMGLHPARACQMVCVRGWS